MKAVLSLTDKGYRARPLRRVYIEKKDKKKKRPLGIPTMYDRAMQALYALALEPVAETTADGKSFGFRKGRCAQDACEYLFNALSRKHILRSGFWRVTSKVVSTISAMIGFWRTSPWTRTF